MRSLFAHGRRSSAWLTFLRVFLFAIFACLLIVNSISLLWQKSSASDKCPCPRGSMLKPESFPGSSRIETQETVAKIPEAIVGQGSTGFVEIVPDMLYVYSAYLQRAASGEAQLKVFLLEDQLEEQSVVECGLGTWQNSTLDVATVKYSPGLKYVHYLNFQKAYHACILTCNVAAPLAESGQLKNVSIRMPMHFHIRDPDTTGSIDVIDKYESRQGNRKYRLSVCVPPLHIWSRAFRVAEVVEFIELNRILGYDQFYLYFHMRSKDLEKAARYYEQISVVSILNWDLPIELSALFNAGQSLAVNDCLFRTKFVSEFTAFFDIDEFLIPQGSYHSWREILPLIFKPNSNVAAYRVPLAYMKAESYPGKRSFKMPMTLNSVWRYPETNSEYCKVVLRPELVDVIGVHEATSFVDQTKSVQEVLDEKIALMYHYKHCSLMRGGCSGNNSQFLQDARTLYYEKELRPRYETTLKLLSNKIS